MMKTKNYVTSLIALLIAIPGYSAPKKSDTEAQGACPSCIASIDPNTTRYGMTRPDLAELLKQTQVENKCTPEMLADLARDTAEIKQRIKNNKAENLDHKFFKADRTDPFLEQFNAVGIVTSGPFTNSVGYGSAILIDKCYVLTNKHVVEDTLRKINLEIEIGRVEYFHVGQNAKCNARAAMSFQDIKATVVDYGEDSRYSDQDWAILKLERPIPSNIKPVKSYGDVVKPGRVLFRAGYPGDALESDAWHASAVRIQEVKVIDNDRFGAIRVSDEINRPGLSGGGVFSVTKDRDGNPRLDIYALHRGLKADISLSAIFAQMAGNGRKTIQDVRRTKAPGTCD